MKHSSAVDIIGVYKFIDGSAESGGGICITDSALTVIGAGTFTSNTGTQGGGIAAVTSFVMVHGSHNFTNNSAFGIGDGGGVSIEQNTTMSIKGTTVFQSNLAYGCGDAIYAVNDSTVYLRENIKLI